MLLILFNGFLRVSDYFFRALASVHAYFVDFMHASCDKRNSLHFDCFGDFYSQSVMFDCMERLGKTKGPHQAKWETLTFSPKRHESIAKWQNNSILISYLIRHTHTHKHLRRNIPYSLTRPTLYEKNPIRMRKDKEKKNFVPLLFAGIDTHKNTKHVYTNTNTNKPHTHRKPI